MHIFQASFLPGLHRVAIEDSCPSGTIVSFFHMLSISKFTSAIGECYMSFLFKQAFSKDGIKNS